MDQGLNQIMADSYTLYLKTQNYHWHVQGVQFRELHKLFETQYLELATAVDDIAERIRTLGFRVPATLQELIKLKSITEGKYGIHANQMLIELANDHDKLVKSIKKAILSYQAENDEGTVNLLANRVAAHEKARWMLNSSCEVN